jgi:hypothetical protein
MLCRDAVRTNRPTRNGANAVINNVAMEWLRTASDCGGGRQSRGSDSEQNSLNFETEDVKSSDI